MALIGQVGAAIVRVTLTLLLQCAGTVALIHWLKPHLRGMNRLGLFRSGVLMVRFTSLIVVLHLLEILLWAGFYRWKLFSIAGTCILLLGSQLFDGRLWRS